MAQLRATDSKWPEPRPDTPIWTCRNSGRRCAPNRKNSIGAIAFFLLSALYILLFAFVVPQAESHSALLWTSIDEEISLPSWLALPGNKSFRYGKKLAFPMRWLWLLTGVAYYSLLFITGEWRRILPQSWAFVANQ